MNPKTIPERLESLSIPEPNSGCLIWLGASDREGYGHVSIGRKIKKAHRISYEQKFGPIPSGLTIDHLCRNTACINPRHMEAVSLRENILRGTGFIAKRFKQTHCIHGHLFNEQNTYIKTDGNRECRICGRESKRKYKMRMRMEKRHGATTQATR